MTPLRARLAVCAFAVAGAGVWWNLMYMQRGTSYSASYAQALPSGEETAREARTPQRDRDTAAASLDGTSSDLVRAVQRELTQRGYNPGPQDGTVSPLTRAAILAYEKDQGLPSTGEASERLLKAMLFSGPPVPAPSASARSSSSAADLPMGGSAMRQSGPPAASRRTSASPPAAGSRTR
jgi:peptidoglycan hydrolase-like protein with peptidoglycan-binding domain